MCLDPYLNDQVNPRDATDPYGSKARWGSRYREDIRLDEILPTVGFKQFKPPMRIVEDWNKRRRENEDVTRLTESYMCPLPEPPEFLLEEREDENLDRLTESYILPLPEPPEHYWEPKINHGNNLWERRREDEILIGFIPHGSHTHIGADFVAMRPEDQPKNHIVFPTTLGKTVEFEFDALGRKKKQYYEDDY